MTISIIIPTYNEEASIFDLVTYLKKHSDAATEIIIADGGSNDQTLTKAREAGVNEVFISKQKGRAAQMNAGAARSSGEVLYFVHADSVPPISFTDDIKSAVMSGQPAGCYRFKFNSDHPLLKINSFLTRFDRIMCRGGDQTLFITRDLFKKLGGYRNDYIIMEDYDLIERIQDRASFHIIPKEVVVSARKYEQNNYLQVQLANFIVFMMYFWGSTQENMLNMYKKLLVHPKF